MLGMCSAISGQHSEERATEQADFGVIEGKILRERGPATLSPENVLIAGAEHQAAEGLEQIQDDLSIVRGGE